LRGAALFIGSLASFLYQYLLWTFDWAFNSLFLVYVALFSLSLWTLILVVTRVDAAEIHEAIGDRFPVRTTAGFSFALGGILLLKCLGEILPGLGSGAMPAGMVGYYTLVDQALDIGLLTPFCVVVGVLLLRRKSLGYLLSSSVLILILSVGLSVVAGENMLGLSTGRMNIVGIAVFSLFILAALCLLVTVLANIAGRPITAKYDERTCNMPGDQFIDKPIRTITHAITIHRSAKDIWPWLIQMGAGRAGWYSYDFIDNGRHKSAERLLPEFRAVSVGSLMPAVPGAADCFFVLQLEPEHSLVLGWVPEANRAPVTTWAFVLNEEVLGVTRLIERGRVGPRYRPYGLPLWLTKMLAPLAHLVMVRKHMRGIARRAETAAPVAEPPTGQRAATGALTSDKP
jgi:hypothetical protein